MSLISHGRLFAGRRLGELGVASFFENKMGAPRGMPDRSQISLFFVITRKPEADPE
jgi:hypothetical protein